MAEHTPGPWVVDIDGRNIIGQGNGYPVVAKAKDDANARLIAAAPEMADTLEEAERCLGNMIFLAEAAEEHGVASGDIDRARRCLAEIQAIRAKAEGRS